MKKKPFKVLTQYNKGFEDGIRVGRRESTEKAILQGFEMHEVCMLYALLDKFKAPDDDIRQLHEGILEYVGMVREGYIEFEAMKKALKDTFNYTFTWKE